MANYLATLRRLASHCEFGTLNEAPRDKLLCGMHRGNIQKVLLTKLHAASVVRVGHIVYVWESKASAGKSPKVPLEKQSG